MPSYILKGVVERNLTVDRAGKDWEEDKGRTII